MTASPNSLRISRRSFLGGCAACAGCCAAVGGLRAAAASAARPKIRAVFCETANDRPIWPNIGYDFDARRQQILDLLARKCPEVEFVPARMMDRPEDVEPILAADTEVQGYLICVQGIGGKNDIVRLCGTGKPTLVVDNVYGGSGVFLTRLPAIRALGQPVDWVSSLNDDDLAASARHFRMLAEGRTAAEIAAAFRATRRARTPGDGEPATPNDRLVPSNVEAALAELKKTRILVVGGPGWGGEAFRKAAAQVFGVEFTSVGFPELQAAYEAADPAAAREFAEDWMRRAERIVEPDVAEMEKSGRMYGAMKALMDRHSARGITINCLDGFYGGHMSAYPCVGFCQFNNDGLVGGCESDQMSALTMMVVTALTGRPGYISDPVIDTSRNAVSYAHCVAMTRALGREGPENPYRLRSHSEDRKGACVQSLLPTGRITTTLEINPVVRQVLFHRAVTIANDEHDMACRTKLVARIRGDLEKLAEGWRMGWHRVTFYGDLEPVVDDLCGRFGLSRIDEA